MTSANVSRDLSKDEAFAYNAPSYYDLKNPSPAFLRNPPSPQAFQSSFENNRQSFIEKNKENQCPQTPEPSNQSLEKYEQMHREQMYSFQKEPFHDRRMSDASTAETVDFNSIPSHRISSEIMRTASFPDAFSLHGNYRRTSNMVDTDMEAVSPSSTISISNRASDFYVNSSKLLQPTKSYLSRIQAEQAFRGKNRDDSMGGTRPNELGKPTLTRPISPRLHTSRQSAGYYGRRGDEAGRMSSTSRELLKIQEERLQLQMERMKIREFHERTKTKRPLADVHQRSTKQLTIPISPHLQVEQRVRVDSHTRHFGSTDVSQSMEEDEDDGFDYGGNNQLRDEPHPPIPPEKLLSRDFNLSVSHHYSTSGSFRRTVPQSPHLATAERAERYSSHMYDEHKEDSQSLTAEQNQKPPSITKPMTPQLETSRRAQQSCQFRKAMDVVDSDEEELSKAFRAKPLNRKIFESKPTIQNVSKPPLTKPIAPRLELDRRIASRNFQEPINEADKERNSAAHKPQRQMPHERQPIIPETPDLKSIHRHRQYQEQFQQKLQTEEEFLKRQREFRAKPIRMAPTPQAFPGSDKPLTEVKPFALPGEKFHERAMERIQSKRIEEEERARQAATFKAKPLPQPFHSSSDSSHAKSYPKASGRPITKIEAPNLASERRALERAAFDAAERERRTHEMELRRKMDAEARQRTDDELRRIRQDLQFHAQPVRGKKAFQLRPHAKPLTEPESPFLHASRPKHRMPPPPNRIPSSTLPSSQS